MQKFTTVFRAVVMFGAAIMIVKGWQLYGLSADQMKSLTARAVDVAATAWNGPQQPADGRLAADPGETAPPFAPPLAQPIDSAAPIAASTSPIVPPTNKNPADSVAFVPPATVEEDTAATADRMPSIEPLEADRLPFLLTRLEALGGMDPKLVEWGTGGQLYRFCCRAALSETSGVSRHFESVAAEPLTAVEDVVAKIAAWRTAERDQGPFDE